MPVIGDSDDNEAGGGAQEGESKKARTADPGCLACAFGLPKPAGHGCVVVVGGAGNKSPKIEPHK